MNADANAETTGSTKPKREYIIFVLIWTMVPVAILMLLWGTLAPSLDPSEHEIMPTPVYLQTDINAAAMEEQAERDQITRDNRNAGYSDFRHGASRYSDQRSGAWMIPIYRQAIIAAARAGQSSTYLYLGNKGKLKSLEEQAYWMGYIKALQEYLLDVKLDPQATVGNDSTLQVRVSWTTTPR